MHDQTEMAASTGRNQRVITGVTGFEHIDKLYVELLYSCQFRCKHCFHGSNLDRKERLSRGEVARALDLFKADYGIGTAVFLGGEPFLHRDIVPILTDAKGLGLRTEVCTNAFRAAAKLARCAGLIDDLRVSVDGLAGTHDELRAAGSFQDCLAALRTAATLGIPASVTFTLTSLNATELPALAGLLAMTGMRYIKVHRLRAVGFAADNAWLEPNAQQLAKAAVDAAEIERETGVRVLMDADIGPDACRAGHGGGLTLDRVEIQPAGQLYISCKAVGDASNAFIYNAATNRVEYRPQDRDEVAVGRPQVVYLSAAAR
jgi:MoaA/NifB/PqqE/SkfB family radical SAM enzyme